MLSNGTRGLALPAYFELLPWGTFPVFTQRTSWHFITRRFTYFFIEPEPAEDFREFTQTCRIVNTRRFLDLLSGEFLPAFVSAPVLANRSSGVTIFPVFSGLARYQYLRISNVRHWGNFP